MDMVAEKSIRALRPGVLRHQQDIITLRKTTVTTKVAIIISLEYFQHPHFMTKHIKKIDSDTPKDLSIS